MQNREGESKILGISKMTLSAFLAGTGIILWMVSVVFSPMNAIKTDIALIQKDISTINSNHLTHLQKYAEEIKDIKQRQSSEDQEIIELQKQILILLQRK